MVLFVTGVCPRTCWYCPLSGERKGKDTTYANEWMIDSTEQAIEVAHRMSALGTGVTGGEPLARPDRVITYCSRLKEEFGPEHHIHLYTGIAPDHDMLTRLVGIVDEIRLHPPMEIWDQVMASDYVVSAVDAKKMGFDIGFEVPALPEVGVLDRALPFLDFLNINELEWGDHNADGMRERNYQLEDGFHNAIEGAREWASQISKDEKVHFCSSSFKDSVQLRKRLIRVARNTARPFDHVTRDGTIIYGRLVIHEKDREWLKRLKPGTSENMGDHVELSWRELRSNAETLSGESCIIERYPDRGIIVEVTPL
ncbi:MAG: 4Fe-4S cluster-binding domain-containing protein [Methanomicrobiales archaeon]|nr:4Fe-4S cluster-binding domain-containing protein [Methanomicrobiales archaeon]